MVFPKQRMSAFRLEDELMNAMDVIRERHGTPYSEMIRRALRLWLEAQGAPVKPAAKRPARGGKGRAK
jgi:hypothetical protein